MADGAGRWYNARGLVGRTPGPGSPVDDQRLSHLERELDNLADIFRRLRPRSAGVETAGFEIFGETRYLNQTAGGDHVLYVDFEGRYDMQGLVSRARRAGKEDIVRELERNRGRVGVLVADASGHGATDALVVAMLHQAFLTGVLYELDDFGGVTPRLFEHLNTRFFNSFAVDRFITLIYGEIALDGTFRFVNAGHPLPLVFSAEFDRFVPVAAERMVRFFPLGMFPSSCGQVQERWQRDAPVTKARYSVNELHLLSPGDVLLLFTDGFAELASRDESFLTHRLEKVMREARGRSARSVFDMIMAAAIGFVEPDDDLSLVVIRRR